MTPVIVYVRLTHVVPVDVGDAYDTDDRFVAAIRADADPDFAIEFIGNGPHVVHDVDWEIETDPDTIVTLDEAHPFHQIEATVIRRSPTS